MAGGVYWIGQDGNIWYKSSYGVNNLGPENAQIISNLEVNQAERINDPMVSTTSPQDSAASSTGGSGGSSGPSYDPLDAAAVENTQKAIDSLGTEQNVGYRNIEDSFNSLLGRYKQEAARNEEDYTGQSTTNSTNLQKNKQNALVAAAQGLRGLRGVLGSIGALSGTGRFLANRAVQQGANEDIGEAADTFAGNSQNLDRAIKRFREEDEDRRREAGTARTNQRTALEGSIANKRQDFYQKMAELFSAAGRTGEATTWLNRAGDLNDIIAQKSRVGATPFTARAAAFTPGELENYLAGAGDMTVDVRSGDSAAPGTVLPGRRRRRDESALAVI